MERVGGQLGRMPLRGREAELLCKLAGLQTTGTEEGPSLDALDDCTGGHGHGPAAVGVKAGFRDAIPLDPHRDAHKVATGCASRGAGVWMVLQGAFSAGRRDVFSERPH